MGAFRRSPRPALGSSTEVVHCGDPRMKDMEVFVVTVVRSSGYPLPV